RRATCWWCLRLLVRCRLSKRRGVDEPRFAPSRCERLDPVEEVLMPRRGKEILIAVEQFDEPRDALYLREEAGEHNPLCGLLRRCPSFIQGRIEFRERLLNPTPNRTISVAPILPRLGQNRASATGFRKLSRNHNLVPRLECGCLGA